MKEACFSFAHLSSPEHPSWPCDHQVSFYLVLQTPSTHSFHLRIQNGYFRSSHQFIHSRKKWKEGEWYALHLKDKSQKVGVLPQLSSHWQTLAHTATPNIRGCWEMQSLFWGRMCPALGASLQDGLQRSSTPDTMVLCSLLHWIGVHMCDQ